MVLKENSAKRKEILMRSLVSHAQVRGRTFRGKYKISGRDNFLNILVVNSLNSDLDYDRQV